MERKLALFIDFENIARGVRQRHLEERVDLRSILGELEEKGRILIKRAYADWGYFKDYRSDLLQQGIEPVQVFAASRDREGWKNGADIRIAIDAIETAFRLPDITDFVLVTGDSDFLSLVNRLRENGKTVWGVGLKTSSSQYLVKSCDHFILYEDIAEWGPDTGGTGEDGQPAKRDARALLLATVRRMVDRQGLPGMPPPGTPLKVGAVRASMRRLEPGWDEQFEGFSNFLDFLAAHSDIIVTGRPSDGYETYMAERNTVAEANLNRMIEHPLGEGAAASEPLQQEDLIALVRRCLRTLGNADEDTEKPQESAVRGTPLKARMRQEAAGFDESQYGKPNFVALLLDLNEHFRVSRAELRGDVLVAERGSPADESIGSLPEATIETVISPPPAPSAPAYGSYSSDRGFSGGSYSSDRGYGNGGHTWVQTPEQKYLGALRIRRIRHVPMAERYAITRQLVRTFEEARVAGEEISLKEAKDRLHRWYEENEPSVPWDHVNNAVYHLFWTYCFEFGEAPDGADDVPLWDRPTRWQGALDSPDEILRKCDTGLVRMISEVVGQVDPKVVLDVLGDGNEERLPYFEEVCAGVNTRFSPALR